MKNDWRTEAKKERKREEKIWGDCFNCFLCFFSSGMICGGSNLGVLLICFFFYLRCSAYHSYFKWDPDTEFQFVFSYMTVGPKNLTYTKKI